MLTVAGYLAPVRVKLIIKNQPISIERERKGTKRNWKTVSRLLVVAAFLAGIIKGERYVAVLST